MKFLLNFPQLLFAESPGNGKESVLDCLQYIRTQRNHHAFYPADEPNYMDYSFFVKTLRLPDLFFNCENLKKSLIPRKKL